MQVTIENYRGIKSASLPLGGIALVAGPNAAGKSAVAQAVGAVLCGHPVPIPGILKNMAGMLVRNGASSGFVQLDADGSTARIDWPRAALKTKGTPPQISAIAAGIESVATVEPKRRAELLIDILQAHPSFDDVRARLAIEGVSDETARSIWETIERQGWDAAHAQAKETGARLKGQWEAVTGKRYGSRVAESYVPDEWEPELASASTEALTAALTDARDTLDAMIAVAAVDDAERERLQRLADELPARQEAEGAARQALQQATEARNAADQAMRALRDPSAQHIHECPHCGGALSIAGGRIVAGSPLGDDEVAAWNAARDAAMQAAEAAAKAREQASAAQAAVREAQDAAQRLASLGSGNATQDQVELARQAVALAQARLDAFTKKTRADRLHSSIVQNAAIVAALDVAGIRQEKLIDCVNSFLTETVNPLSKIANWHRIEVTSDLSIAFGGRAWELLSESEKYRAKVLLQIAIAIRQSACAVVIDAADILDKAGRNGLVSLLRHAAIPAVVCMTIPTPQDVPNLRAVGIGESYWIRDGVLVPLDSVPSK